VGRLSRGLGDSLHRRGGALLAVLWLSAALAAIAFSAAQMVKAGRERTRNQMEGAQAELLADSAIERVLLEMQAGLPPAGGIDRWQPGRPVVRVAFPAGHVLVEVMPESAKIDVNAAPPDLLARLMVALDVPLPTAAQLSTAIVLWRSPVTVGGAFDPIQSLTAPTFRVPHASLEQIEDLLSVPGITPELFYGRIERAPDGSWVPRAGLRDCLSIDGSIGPYDVNSAQPAVLLAAGLSPAVVGQLVAIRRAQPITAMQLAQMAPALGDAARQLTIDSGDSYTLRATARVRLPDGRMSELRRTATRTVLLNARIDPGRIRVHSAHAGASARSLEESWPW
jgi:general secretion pathway protein K